jgi:hypothetical protein
MSAEAPKLETTLTTPAPAQTEAEQQQQTQPQPQPAEQKQDEDQSVTDEKAKPTEEEPTAAPEKKPNPLKKVASIFKTLFGCLRKPAVRELEDQAKENVAEEVKAAAGEEQPSAAAAQGEVAGAAEAEKKTEEVEGAGAAKDGEAVKA